MCIRDRSTFIKGRSLLSDRQFEAGFEEETGKADSLELSYSSPYYRFVYIWSTALSWDRKPERKKYREEVP